MKNQDITAGINSAFGIARRLSVFDIGIVTYKMGKQNQMVILVEEDARKAFTGDGTLTINENGYLGFTHSNVDIIWKEK